MLTQESAYKQIQDAKTMVEDDLQHKLEEFEEERDRLFKLANTASALERELEQVVSVNNHTFYLECTKYCNNNQAAQRDSCQRSHTFSSGNAPI